MVLHSNRLSALRCNGRFTRHFVQIIILSIVSTSFLIFFLAQERRRLPPLYASQRTRERMLPQHNKSLPFPEGKGRKYFFNANHSRGSGWGNAMQELVLTAHLAYVAKRAFVFDQFTWETGKQFSSYNGKLIPASIPLSAIISGPIVGAPFKSEEDRASVPRSVSSAFYRQVCSNSTILKHPELGDKRTGAEILKIWVEKLNAIEDPCVELSLDTPHVFSFWVLDLWPSLYPSPMLQDFGWSPLVMSAFRANEYLLLPRVKPLLPFLPSLTIPSLASLFPDYSESRGHLSTVKPKFTKIRGLLALHLRRGDYSNHCSHLAKYTSTFNGFNTFPELSDRFVPPPSGPEFGVATPEAKKIYQKRCWPSISDIVEKVREVRKQAYSRGVKLDRAYFMTNGKEDWIEQLKAALNAYAKDEVEGEWNALVSSRDLSLGWEQKPVAHGLDMYIGQRAEYFIGNGVSAFSKRKFWFAQDL